MGAIPAPAGIRSAPEAVSPLASSVVVVFAGIVSALADTDLDAISAQVADVQIAQVYLVAVGPVLGGTLAAECTDVFVIVSQDVSSFRL